jgi:hypothetical protein
MHSVPPTLLRLHAKLVALQRCAHLEPPFTQLTLATQQQLRQAGIICTWLPKEEPMLYCPGPGSCLKLGVWAGRPLVIE